MRRRCPESKRYTGLKTQPKYRLRCMACGNLVRLVNVGPGLCVAPHYYQAELDYKVGKQHISEGRF